MTAEQLRNSILQEAISGRLVPQDPNDEPASVLLRRIREEKARLVKEGKLKKKDLAETPITAEEIPFEIPASWEWCRVQQVIKVKSGDGLNVRSLKDKAQYPVYGGNGINGTYHQYNVEADTLVIGRVGFYCGAVHKTYGKAWVTDNALIVSFVKTGIFVDFLKYVLTWLKIRRTSNSTAQPVVSGKGIYPLIFPLPPLAEQKRIVAKLEELLPIVEQYGKAQKELDELNAALPTRLRQSILQEAISGRLVPQDPNEDAEDVKTIEIEDASFEIPNNWRWCSLGDLVDMVSGTSYKKDDVRTKGVRILRGGNIVNDELVLAEDDVFLPDEYANLEKNIRKDDIIIVASTGSQKVIGKPALIRQNYDKTQIGAFLRIIRAKDVKYVPFLWLIFKGMYYREHIRNLVKGTNINNIKEEYITTLPIPLPPLAEQKRIVAKIEELFAEIDKLK